MARVTSASVPSDPITSWVRSYPLVDFTNLPPVVITSPVPRTASRPRTWWRVTPYLTARIPPALVDTLPPNEARLLAGEHRVDEAVGKQRGVQIGQRHPRLDHGHMVGHVDLDDPGHPFERHDHAVGRPGCTPRTARYPSPRAVRGMPWATADLTMAATSAVELGRTTASGRTAEADRASSWVSSSLMSHPTVDVVGTDDSGQLVDHRHARTLPLGTRPTPSRPHGRSTLPLRNLPRTGRVEPRPRTRGRRAWRRARSGSTPPGREPLDPPSPPGTSAAGW